MNVIYFLLPVTLCLGGSFIIWFIWSVKQGQYDDLNTPALRMLLEDETIEEQAGDENTGLVKKNNSIKSKIKPENSNNV